MNFDSSASPSARPTPSQPQARPRQTSTSAARPSVQNTTSGASGVTIGAPAMSGIEIHSNADSAAIATDGKSRQAIHAISAGRAARMAEFSARTPNSLSPNSAVEAPIQAATIGG